jgi:hypothetical protein
MFKRCLYKIYRSSSAIERWVTCSIWTQTQSVIAKVPHHFCIIPRTYLQHISSSSFQGNKGSSFTLPGHPGDMGLDGPHGPTGPAGIMVSCAINKTIISFIINQFSSKYRI